MSKQVNKKNDNKKKIYRILSYLLLIVSIFFVNIILYLNILPLNILLLIIPFAILILFLIYKLNHKGIVLTKLIVAFISIVIIVVESLLIIYLLFSLNFIESIFDNNKYNETYGIYVVSDKYKAIKELNNKNIVIYEKDDYIDKSLDILSNKIEFKKNKEKSIEEAIDSVLDGTNDALVINENLINLYKEQYEISLKRIKKIDVYIEKDQEYTEVNVKKNPFVVYLSGIDDKGKIASSARSDVNIMAVINPISRKVLVVNTPRDYYVELASKKAKDKLTHAGIYGVNESAKTLGKLYDVDVNYYVRINFSSFIKIIDTLGGVTVDVEKPDYRYNLSIDCGKGYICEQNSDREIGNSLIKFKYGVQKLDGEEALAYARNRHQYASGDIARQKHQAQIIEQLVKKVSNKSIITKYPSLVKLLSSNIKTNISKDTIKKLVASQLKNNKDWQIENMIATGHDSYNVAYSTGKYKVYVLEPDKESVSQIQSKIKEVMQN